MNKKENNIIKQLVSKEAEQKKIIDPKVKDDLKNLKKIYSEINRGKTNHLL